MLKKLKYVIEKLSDSRRCTKHNAFASPVFSRQEMNNRKGKNSQNNKTEER